MLRVCVNGHKYIKSSDCPFCPICESNKKPKKGFMAQLAAPARRALEKEGIKTLKQLAEYSESEILNLHGMGKSAVSKIKTMLNDEGMCFSNR